MTNVKKLLREISKWDHNKCLCILYEHVKHSCPVMFKKNILLLSIRIKLEKRNIDSKLLFISIYLLIYCILDRDWFVLN